MLFVLRKTWGLLVLLFWTQCGLTHADYDLGAVLNAPGLHFTQPEGALYLTFHNNNFALYFLDEAGKVIAPWVKEASLRVETNERDRSPARADRPGSKKTLTLVLAPNAQNSALTNNRFVPAPFSYWITLTLIENDTQAQRVLGRYHFVQSTD